MISIALWLLVIFLGAGCIVWGAEEFAEHLAAAGRSHGVSTLALALLLAGAEPEELATCLTASVRKLPAIAVGDAGDSRSIGSSADYAHHVCKGIPVESYYGGEIGNQSFAFAQFKLADKVY